MRRRIVGLALVSALALGAAVGSVLALATGETRSSARPTQPSPPADRFRGSEPPGLNRLPAFSLRDQHGRRLRSRDLPPVVLVTFLDSQCREACPLIVRQLAGLRARLTPEERRHVEALAFTVDPQEDTPAAVRAFLRKQRAGGAVRYLLGSERELRPLWRAFHVLAVAESGSDDIHSAPVRIYGGGVWLATLHPGADLDADALLHDVRAALS